MDETIVKMNKEVLKYLIYHGYSVEEINTIFLCSDLVPDIYRIMHSTLGIEGIDDAIRDVTNSLMDPDYGTSSMTF